MGPSVQRASVKISALFTILLIFIFGVTVSAAEEQASEFIYGDYKLTILDDNTAEIAGWTGSDRVLSIPSSKLSGKKGKNLCAL
jgi:hypothetical protein